MYAGKQQKKKERKKVFDNFHLFVKLVKTVSGRRILSNLRIYLHITLSKNK